MLGISQNGLPPMPGDRDPVGGCVQATDGGGGTFLPVAVEGTGTLQGVWGGDGGWIDESTHEDTTWASGRRDMELDNLSHRGITADVSHGLPGQGRPADLHG